MFNYYKTPTIFVHAEFLVDFCFPPAKVNKPKHGILATLAANMTSKFHMGSQNTASARISRNQRRVLGIICSAANLWCLFSLGVPGLFFVSSWWCWTKPFFSIAHCLKLSAAWMHAPGKSCYSTRWGWNWANSKTEASTLTVHRRGSPWPWWNPWRGWYTDHRNE